MRDGDVKMLCSFTKSFKTRHDNVLDLIPSSDLHLVGNVDILTPIRSSDHFGICYITFPEGYYHVNEKHAFF